MGFIVTAGEILVEILADTQGHGFRQAQALTGPFPSGAPAIFIDQVGKLGVPCGMIGAVGDDDFGWLNLDRLRADGVDISAITVIPGAATGSAFVRYRPNGERDFIFNLKDSASGQLAIDEAGVTLLDKATHFHLAGSSVSSDTIREVVRVIVETVKTRGGTVSFDPNVRRELLDSTEARTFFDWILERTDIFLPSGEEVFLFTAASRPDTAAAELIARGIPLVVIKDGVRGATGYRADGSIAVPAHRVDEIDPTGAGDCFCAAFVACHVLGENLEDSLRYANAAGGRQVTVRGPMEGTSTFAELDSWMEETPVLDAG
ncbi:sugar kinase [Bauldia sp.]|uniref:tagatose kinase n=1 Tax=Bauldia sp. TaxID=2575872 RepID=UPI003BA86249